MLEVGAARPDYLSIGECYRKSGWRVVSIEPNPEFCDMHRALGNEVYEYACSDEDKDDVDFFLVDSHAAEYLDGNVTFESFSSLGLTNEFKADLARSKFNPTVSATRVKVRKLDTILQQHLNTIKKIDLLAVDVEGWELAVMRGFDVKKYRPDVVILENLFKSRTYRKQMRKLGYNRWTRLKPNEVFVRSDLHPTVPDYLLRLLSL